MSGICGLYNLDGQPVEANELRAMTSILMRRGPERREVWSSQSIGLGHTLLATTPEAVFERLPFVHSQSGCVITGDIRLDNRAELLTQLGLSDRASVMGDGELALCAYVRWGETCVEHFLGDFALAVWDPRDRTLFCARDQMGMRGLYYHHTPGRFVAFATEPRAILVLPQVPYRIDDARIADFLVPELEGIDKTSTFFDGVYRLPPAHTMTVTSEGVRQRRYWTLEAWPELRLPSRAAYVDAFLDVFREAVRCRLRTVGPPGSMLSGGMDSGAIAAVARGVLASDGRGPLHTFSAASSDGAAEPETRAIRQAIEMDGLAPSMFSYGELEQFAPELSRLTWEVEEPFDAHMTLIRCAYLAARRSGHTVLLDGGGGDTVLAYGREISRLLRAGHWRTAYRDAAGLNRYWGGAYPPAKELLADARVALVPDGVLRRVRPLRQRRRTIDTIAHSLASEDLAHRVDLPWRLERLESHGAGSLARAGVERVRAIDHPYLTVGRERYDRVAAAVGIEPRDPFLDLRVVALCVRLPGWCTLDRGWPKAILRLATAGELPDPVRWRRGKEHLGWDFTKALLAREFDVESTSLESDLGRLDGYIREDKEHLARQPWAGLHDSASCEDAFRLVSLVAWLRDHADRPVVQSSGEM